MEDECSIGNDENRCFILSSYASNKMNRVPCVLCGGLMNIFERFLNLLLYIFLYYIILYQQSIEHNFTFAIYASIFKKLQQNFHKRPVYIFAFGEFNSQPVNVGGIHSKFPCAILGLGIAQGNFECRLHLSGGNLTHQMQINRQVFWW